MNETALFTFSNFSGVNNTDEKFRLPKNIDNMGMPYQSLSVLQNLDVTNQSSLKTRPGSEKKLSGTGIHSMWSDNVICLYVSSSGSLYRLTSAYGSELLMSGLHGENRMSYARLNDRIYFTNFFDIGYYDGSAARNIPEPSIKYKMPLPAGRLILSFSGRLFVAKDNILYISDVLCDHYDIRTGYKRFEEEITMLNEVDAGIYVSDNKVWFVSGVSPEEFVRKKVADIKAIPYTGITVDGGYMGDGSTEKYVLWGTTEGIYSGDSSGAVKILTQNRYKFPEGRMGCSAIRKKDMQNHYIITIEK